MNVESADTAVGQAAWSLCKRELVRFARQPGRVASSIGTPLLMWLFLGAGLNRSFRPADAADGGPGFLAYFFPGSLVFVVLNSCIVSNISVIEDRQVGFLQGVLVAPVSRAAIALGKILGGAIMATAQGAIFLMAAPLSGLHFGVFDAVIAILTLFFVAFALTALGFIFAWRSESVGGFHGVMMMLFMPLWMLSGAIFPISGAHHWLRWAVWFDPLSYGLSAIRLFLGGSRADMVASPWICYLILIGFAALLFRVAVLTVRPRPERGL